MQRRTGRGSPPARGRGLKRQATRVMPGRYAVAPRAGAWIETTSTLLGRRAPAGSPPARGRGLKHAGELQGNRVGGSPPARGRGLKRVITIFRDPRNVVAPRAGAWIETSGWAPPPPLLSRSPPARGQGLKLTSRALPVMAESSPPARGMD